VSPVKYELGFYIPEDAILHSHCRENLRSYTEYVDCSNKFASVYPAPEHCSVSIARYGRVDLYLAFTYQRALHFDLGVSVAQVDGCSCRN
jgi:hypothetical protein